MKSKLRSTTSLTGRMTRREPEPQYLRRYQTATTLTSHFLNLAEMDFSEIELRCLVHHWENLDVPGFYPTQGT